MQGPPRLSETQEQATRRVFVIRVMLYDESPYPGFSHLQIADVSLDYAIEGVPREVKGTRCQLRPNPVDRLHDARTTRLRWNRNCLAAALKCPTCGSAEFRLSPRRTAQPLSPNRVVMTADVSTIILAAHARRKGSRCDRPAALRRAAAWRSALIWCASSVGGR